MDHIRPEGLRESPQSEAASDWEPQCVITHPWIQCMGDLSAHGADHMDLMAQLRLCVGEVCAMLFAARQFGREHRMNNSKPRHENSETYVVIFEV